MGKVKSSLEGGWYIFILCGNERKILLTYRDFVVYNKGVVVLLYVHTAKDSKQKTKKRLSNEIIPWSGALAVQGRKRLVHALTGISSGKTIDQQIKKISIHDCRAAHRGEIFVIWGKSVHGMASAMQAGLQQKGKPPVGSPVKGRSLPILRTG